MDQTRTVATPFSAVISHHGEGPVWLGDLGLGMVDMLAGDLILLDGAGRLSARVHVDDVLAAIRPRCDGGLVAATERGFALLDRDLEVTDRVDCWTDPAVRMNDGGCDPFGRFWCGSMAYDLTPRAADLWRFDPDGSVAKVLDGIGCSNGLAWTEDGTRGYYVDSLTDRIDLLDVDPDGSVLDRRPFVEVTEGFPDGIAVDRDGGVWLAIFWGSRLVHFDRDGHRDAEIELPTHQVTACAFGGPDHAQLYITTSRNGLAEPEPLAGAVFVAEPPVPGFAPFAFAG